MKNRQIVNIVNFIRGVEPRYRVDMTGAVRNQIACMKKHYLRGTFLIQYDALLMPEYVDMLQTLDPEQFELGVWYEVVQPLTEAVGIEWTGRYSWDWHTDCGFPMGYDKVQREALIDELFEKFKSVFGFYPRVLGSWVYDTHTIRYAEERYGLDAICNCKEQYGTDGYTLWGGYYGQGYYPCKNNVFLPAQNKDNQINVPLFRMLGSDPVYQYDIGVDPSLDEQEIQMVITLEPCCGAEGCVEDPDVDMSFFTEKPYGGNNKEWTQWYMNENFNGECLSFGYTQAGQENAFGWQWMAKGYIAQCELFENLVKEGKIEVEPLGDTGRWYKQTYTETPASAIVAHCAYDDDNINSVWYSSKNYRVNLYCDESGVKIRDIHIFSDEITDPFENEVCNTHTAVYEALPFVDGCRYTGRGVLAGGYISCCDGSKIHCNGMTFKDKGEGCAAVSYGDFHAELNPCGIKLVCDRDFIFENRIGTHGNHLPETTIKDEKTLCFTYNGVNYAVRLVSGFFCNERMINSENNIIEMKFA